MDKLMALPVSGDAFLLKRGNQNILVDGGYSSRTLLAALSAPKVSVTHLHIVVCTHADKDHAGGLTDFLDKSSIRIGEFWLPGAWSDSLPDLLQNPRLVMDKLVAELDQYELEVEDDLDQDDDQFEARVHARIAEERRGTQRERREHRVRADAPTQDNNAGLEWLRNQAADLELDAANDAASAKEFGRGRRLVRYRASKSRMRRHWVAFWLNLIDTAERIRKIAVQAIRHNVKVRWFDFGEFVKSGKASGGEPDLLLPLNAVELRVPPSPISGLQYRVLLTPVNEECLVFFSPAYRWPNGLGVVFTGDSPLGNGHAYHRTFLDCSRKLLPAWVVATAPHHGSESNNVAYTHLEKMTNVLLWLRSGGSSKHPGATFRKLPPARRGCTHCPHLKLERELVEVQLSCPLPIFRVRAHDCVC